MKIKSAILFAFLPLYSLFAASPKVSPDMPATGNVDVIIQYAAAPTAAQQKSLLGLGGILKPLLNSLNAIVTNISVGALKGIVSDPNVIYVSPDRAVKGMLEFANPTVNANLAAQFGVDGKGVGIALVDSGVSSNPDLNAPGLLGQLGLLSRVVYNQSFVPGQSAQDQYGHGTHVAGILAGNAQMSSGTQFAHTFRGIAPNAQIVNLKVLDAKGRGSDSTVIQAIEQAVALKNRFNIRVLNLSLGRPVFESYRQDPLCQAVEYAWKNGIVVVVAAGNDGRDNSAGTHGYGTILAPANDPFVITVGAMKDEGSISRGDDQIASYSSKGPAAIDHIVKPDLVAPGNRIVSIAQPGSTLYQDAAAGGFLLPSSYYRSGASGNSTQYLRMNGTSMAAPMVSGAAALLIDQDGTLTPDQVKARLMLTASKTFPVASVTTDPATGESYTSYYDIFTVGAGYLDVWAALSDNHRASGSAASPTAIYDAATGKVRLAATATGYAGQASVWNSAAGWSSSAVWGASVLVSGTASPSSGSSVWGTSTVWGSSPECWGDGSVFGTSTVWGSSPDSDDSGLSSPFAGEK